MPQMDLSNADVHRVPAESAFEKRRDATVPDNVSEKGASATA